jgi:hypothetical protein
MNRRESPLIRFAALVRDMCQLRRGPEDVPYSTRLLVALICASVVLDVLIGTSAALDVASDSTLGDWHDVLARSLVSTTLVLSLCWIALAVRHVGNRYVQTASALVACSLVFSLLILPLAWLAGPAPASAAALTPRQTLVGWAMLAVVVWQLVVNAHIVRRAIDAPFALGFALALAWALADWALGHVLFDPAQ